MHNPLETSLGVTYQAPDGLIWGDTVKDKQGEFSKFDYEQEVNLSIYPTSLTSIPPQKNRQCHEHVGKVASIYL